MKIVVVSPHRDDAAFSLGIAVDRWLAQGRAVEVVDCFTRSAYAPFSDAGSLHENDRRSFVTALRRREDEAWRRLCGRGLTSLDLNLKDAPLRLNCSAEEVCGMPVRPEEKAVAKIRAAIAGVQTPLVLPLALGAHVDHATARDASLSAIDVTAPLAFYEDLPYAARGEDDEIQSCVAAVTARFGVGLAPWFAQPEADADAAVERKRRMALCYDSQVDDATVSQIAEFCRRYQGRERFWVNQAWLAAEERAR